LWYAGEPQELAEARWFTRDEVAEALQRGLDPRATGVRTPPRNAMAHHLLRAWVDSASGTAAAKF